MFHVNEDEKTEEKSISHFTFKIGTNLFVCTLDGITEKIQWSFIGRQHEFLVN